MARLSKTFPRLMAISDREALGMGDLLAAARSAVAAGLPALMLREKDLPDEQILPLAQELRAMTSRAGTLFMINRRLNVGRAVRADGVHLGIDGPTIPEARKAMGSESVLGYSAHDPNEALRAFDQGADYVIFSPIFETPSKQGILQPVGLEALARLAKIAPGPLIALGGISLANIAEVARTGAAGAAVVRAIFGSGDPGAATKRLLEAWTEATRAVPLGA